MRPDGVACFAGDLSADEQAVVYATHFAPALDLFTQKHDGVAWRTKQSWAVVCTEDRTVHPDLERSSAKRGTVAPCTRRGGAGLTHALRSRRCPDAACQRARLHRDGGRDACGARMTDEAGLKAACCWFPKVDRLSKDPETTAWKQRARKRQADWRERQGLTMGSHTSRGRDTPTANGSRILLSQADRSSANFVTSAAYTAALARVGAPEKYEVLKKDRLWSDLLSSMPMCFNLFGDLYVDRARAAEALRAWWPAMPTGDVEVKFEHSPGRCDMSFIGTKTSMDVALEVPSAHAILGVETKYHEHLKRGGPLRKEALDRCIEVAERSRIFADGWRDALPNHDLEQIWLDHVLVLSMLQHPSRRWTWGRFVLVYPSENPSFRRAAARYRALLRDTSTFEARTLESLLDAPGALGPATVQALRERYL
jgi:hypothetical protein